MIRRVLISVSDKTGIVEFTKGLLELFNLEIISTGGTAKVLREAGIDVVDVSKVTGFPEMMDGRVKTLHPSIHGGLLALRKNPEHMDSIKKHGIIPIDMVVVNLYPFEKTVQKEDCSLEDAIENIDIGGPSMIRSASKNFESVIIIVNPERYKEILEELKLHNGEVPISKRKELAVEAFSHTAEYDTVIYNYLYSKLLEKPDKFQEKLLLRFNKIQSLRYGENPHQSASFYSETKINEPCITNSKQLHGKELSYNNIMDTDAAIELVKEFDRPAVVIIKHTNPCGVAIADTIESAFRNAYETDSVSAFGGIVALNRKLTLEIAEFMKTKFLEVVVASEFEKSALDILKEKKDIRLLELRGLSPDPASLGARDYPRSRTETSIPIELRKVTGGVLVQERDKKDLKKEELKVVTKRKPTSKELDDMLFSWKVVKHVKSNAIVIAKDGVILGVGAGQMNRIGSVKIATEAASTRSKGAVLASDAFFPKPDGIEEANKSGVAAVIQPGGSIQDKEVIDTADKYNIAMVFTGIRHFKH